MLIDSIYSIKDFPYQNKLHGRYVSKSPMGAAKKAFTQIIKKMNVEQNIINNNSKFILFTIINRYTNKEYKYIGKRIELGKPVVIQKNGKSITYKYRDIIGKYKDELDLESKSFL
jgi:hypothetical protein